MHFLRTMAFAIFAGASIAAAAQANSTAADPASATAAAGRITYQPAFAGYQPFTDPGEPEETTWRAANEAVSGAGGHAGHDKGKPADAAATSPHAGMNHQKEAK
jgi:hypothetical protein